MRYWFTADLHLDHANIIKYCSRPFSSLCEMNKMIIRRWNQRIKPEDTVFIIGDFCFKGGMEGGKTKSQYWQERLNGKKVFVKGNHDKNNSTKTIIERLVIGYGGKRINLVHDPEFADVNYEINLTGHVHENWEVKRIRKGWQFTDCINVGVDVWNFYPASFEEIMKRYRNWLKQREGRDEIRKKVKI